MKQFYLIFWSLTAISIGLWFPEKGEISNSFFGKEKIEKEKPQARKSKRVFVLKPQNHTAQSLLLPTLQATKTVEVNGGGSATIGSVLNYTIDINNTGTDATNVIFSDALSADLTFVALSLKATPIAANDNYTSIGNVGITVNAANGLMSNDISPDNTTLSVSPVTDATTTDGGKITIGTDGSFDYTPKTGTSSLSDTYTYTLNSTNGTTGTGTVTISISGILWFVNNTVSTNGDGSLARPFKQWSDFGIVNTGSGLVPKDNHTVFVYSGTGDYSGAVTLRPGQKILGQGSTTSLSSFAEISVPAFSKTLPAVNLTAPNLISSGNTITLSSGSHKFRGFSLGNSTKAIVGSTFGTLTLDEVQISGTGQALDLTSGALAANITSLSSTNSNGSGVSLNAVSGTLTVSVSTTITNPTASGISITGASTVNCNFGNSTINQSGNTALVLNSTSSQSNTFGELNIAPDANVSAINSSSAGTITCTSGTISTSGAVGATIGNSSSATMGTLAMVLTSFTASGSTAGLIVRNTNGSFSINGSSTTAGSGGSISNVSQKGIEARNTASITLKNMNFTNANTIDGVTSSNTDNSGSNAALYFNTVNGLVLDNIQMNATAGNANAQHGISLNNVNNFSLNNSTITRCGTSNDTEACIYAVNTTGTCTISNSTLSKASRLAIFSNTNSNMTLKVTASNFLDTRTLPDVTTLNANGQSGLLFQGMGTSVMSLDVKSNCNFLRIGTQGVNVLGEGSAVINADVLNSIFNATNATLPAGEDVGLGILMENTGTSVIKFNIKNNTITGRGGNLIGLGTLPGSTAKMEGTVENNIINYNFVSSVSNNAGYGINYNHISGNTDSRVKITGNTLSNFNADGTLGISSLVQAGSANIIVTNNNISHLPASNTTAGYAIRVTSSVSGATGCVRLANNSVTNNALSTGYAQLRASVAGATLNIEGSGDIATPHVSIWNYNLNTPNIASNTSPTFISSGGAGTRTLVAANTCLSPTNNLVNLRISGAEKNLAGNPTSLESFQVDSIIKGNEIYSVNNNVLEESKIQVEKTRKEIINGKIVKLPSETLSKADIESGETITVNGSGTGFNIPAGKSTRITFSAQVSLSPSTCLISNQATISGSNFIDILTDDPNVTGISNPTDISLVIPAPAAINTNTASPICLNQNVTMSTTCSSGDVQWYNSSTGGTFLGTSLSGQNFVHSPAATTTYYAACKVAGCESQRTQGASITVNPLPDVTLSVSGTSVCQNTSLSLSVPTGAQTYTWSGNGIVAQNSNATTATPVISGDQTYSVTVSTALGCTASSSVTVNVKEAPVPVPGNDSPKCEGQTLTFNSVAGMTNYSWVGPNSFTSSDQNPQIANVSTSAGGTYSLTVTNNQGCSGSATTEVTINQGAVTNINSNSPVCAGQTLNFNSTDGMNSYSWSGPNSFVSSIKSPEILMASSAASGIYSLTVSNSYGCSASSTISVTVNALPVVEISVNSPYCVGDNLELSTLSSYNSYSWTGPNSFSSSLAAPIINNITASEGGVYSVSVTDINGCIGMGTASVTVNSLPVPGTGSNSPLCNGQTINLTSAAGMSHYSWTGPNGFISSDQNPEILNSTENNEGTYYLTVTSQSCTATASLSVIINDLPEPIITAPASVCEGGTISLSTISGMSTYSWTGPNGFTSTDVSPGILNAAGLNQGIYSVTVTNLSGCTASATASVTITVTPPPTLGSNSPVCVGKTLGLTSSSADSYSWTGPNAFTSTSQNPDISSVTSLAGGTYTLNVIYGACTASNTILVTVNDLPVITIGGGGVFCENSDITLTSGGGTTYSWTGPNSFTSSDQNPVISSFSNLKTGTYTVTVTDLNSCSATSTIELSLKPLPDVSLTSNSPVCENGQLTATSTVSNNNIGDIILYSWKGPDNFSSSLANLTVNDASPTASGTYTLTVSLNSCIDSATINLEILAKPALPAAIDQHVCVGGNITVQASCNSGTSIVWFSDIEGLIPTSNSLVNVSQSTVIYAACKRNDINFCQGDLKSINVLIDSIVVYTPVNVDFNNLYLCENGNGIITLNNTLKGNNLSFQWQLNTGSGFSNLVENANYSGVNNDTLMLTNIPVSFQDYKFRVNISNICGSIVSDTTTLKINVLPVVVNEPQGQTVCPGNEIAFEVNATGTGLSYFWEINSGSGFVPVSGSSFSGINSKRLVVSNIQNNLNNVFFRCKVFNSCVVVYSQQASLVVDPTVTIISQPTSKSICQGLSTSFTVISAHLSNGVLNYQWQRKSGNSWVNLSNSLYYSGVNSSTLSVLSAPYSLNNTEYRCLINSYCQTSVVSLGVTPIAAIVSQPSSVTICQGNNATYSVNATGINLSYRWQVNMGSGFTDILDGGIYQGASTSSLSLSFPDNTFTGYKYRCRVTGNGPCDTTPVISNEAILTIGVSAEAMVIVAISPVSSNLVYQAVQSVLGINSISAGANVSYQAGNSILLSPGFVANSGSIFTAKIQNPCFSNVVNTNGTPGLPKEIKK
ncbi:MAG: hypothetical protein U0V04_03640 [Spirosomataceae bacterium]|jgi:hypothetical protein